MLIGGAFEFDWYITFVVVVFRFSHKSKLNVSANSTRLSTAVDCICGFSLNFSLF